MTSSNTPLGQLFPVTDNSPQIFLDSVKLVCEVKKYPIIYDSKLRRDQFVLFTAWEAVAVGLLPNFHLMSESDKFVIRKKLRFRWRWMRTTLRRDLSRNRMKCHIHLKWMQEMQFLVPLLSNKRKDTTSVREQRQDQSTFPEIASTVTQNVVTSTTSTSNVIQPCRSPIPINVTPYEHLQKLSSSTQCIPSVPVNNLPSQDLPPKPSSSTECVEPAAVNVMPNQHFQTPSSTTHMQLKPSSLTQTVSQNETMVKMFISAFSSEVFTTSKDPDVNFLFTLLHVFRNLRMDQKETLKNKFLHTLKQ